MTCRFGDFWFFFLLLSRHSLSEALASFMCNAKGKGGACLKKPPALPKDRIPGPEFEEKTQKDIEMQRLMKQMKDMGMGGQMYGRDDMDDLMDDYRDEGDMPGMDGMPPGMGMDGMGDMGGGADDAPPLETESTPSGPSVMDKIKDAGQSAWNWGKGLFSGGQKDAASEAAPAADSSASAAAAASGDAAPKKKSTKKKKSKKKTKSAKAPEL